MEDSNWPHIRPVLHTHSIYHLSFLHSSDTNFSHVYRCSSTREIDFDLLAQEGQIELVGSCRAGGEPTV